VAAPRDFLAIPKRFGDSPRDWWNPIAPGTEATVLAAYRQHLTIVNLRVAARCEGLVTDALLADHLNYRTETLRRKARGYTWVTAEDLARWELTFAGTVAYPAGTQLEAMPFAE
jgi:hypothetical protein